jgi:anti-sigma regulatory factor (Ser/Thr protein kinase)
MLDRDFDADALAGLREAVLSYAAAHGMPRDRAIDVMLAVHELAANAVRHGAGHGRVRVELSVGTLRCEVSDPGPASRDGHALGGTGWRAPGAAPWPVEQGHGLWLVTQAADQVRATCGPDGSLITVLFTLPTAVAPAPRAGTQGIRRDGTGR